MGQGRRRGRCRATPHRVLWLTTHHAQHWGRSQRRLRFAFTFGSPTVHVDRAFDPTLAMPHAHVSSMQVCTSSACVTYSYQAGPWGGCSVSCGRGQQTRSVYCGGSDGSTLASDSKCSMSGRVAVAAPSSSQACVMATCVSYSYQVSGPGLFCFLQSAGPGIGQREVVGSTSARAAGLGWLRLRHALRSWHDARHVCFMPCASICNVCRSELGGAARRRVGQGRRRGRCRATRLRRVLWLLTHHAQHWGRSPRRLRFALNLCPRVPRCIQFFGQACLLQPSCIRYAWSVSTWGCSCVASRTVTCRS